MMRSLHLPNGSRVTDRVKNPVGNSIAVVKATAPLSHSTFRPHIERFFGVRQLRSRTPHFVRISSVFLECESGAVAFTLSYLQVEKDFLHGLVRSPLRLGRRPLAEAGFAGHPCIRWFLCILRVRTWGFGLVFQWDRGTMV